MSRDGYVKVAYGYRVMRDGWAVGRLVRDGDLWSVQGNDGRELYAFRDLADARRATRNLPPRGPYVPDRGGDVDGQVLDDGPCS